MKEGEKQVNTAQIVKKSSSLSQTFLKLPGLTANAEVEGASTYLQWRLFKSSKQELEVLSFPLSIPILFFFFLYLQYPTMEIFRRIN